LDDKNPHLAEKFTEIPCDYPGIFKALVDAKADINARNDRGMTPLSAAAILENVEAVNALLAAGADPNVVDDNARSALMAASHEGCLDAVSALIAAGADVNHMCSSGTTPLLLAISRRNVDMVSALIAAGADVNHVAFDRTALDDAAKRHGAMIAILNEAGALTWEDLMVKTNELLYRDITESDKIILNIELIDQASDKDKENALKFYVTSNSLTMVKSLLAAGVNPSLRFRRWSLLCESSSKGNTDIVEALLAAGADITFKDRGDGKTALQHAAKNKHREIVALLLAKATEIKNANK
jgi:ankyrin repeat protein